MGLLPSSLACQLVLSCNPWLGSHSVEISQVLFPIMYRGYDLTIGILALWLLQSLPLCIFSLSLRCRGCVVGTLTEVGQPNDLFSAF